MPKLRARLEAIAEQRTLLESLQRENRLKMGNALLEVSDDENLTLTEAAEILGISRWWASQLVHHGAEGKG
jgi:DNA-directed RNA polymerase specialized sigma subunit